MLAVTAAQKGASDWVGKWEKIPEHMAADFHRELQWVATKNIRTRRDQRREKLRFATRLRNLAPEIRFDPHSLMRAEKETGGPEEEAKDGDGGNLSSNVNLRNKEAKGRL